MASDIKYGKGYEVEEDIDYNLEDDLYRTRPVEDSGIPDWGDDDDDDYIYDYDYGCDGQYSRYWDGGFRYEYTEVDFM